MVIQRSCSFGVISSDISCGSAVSCDGISLMMKGDEGYSLLKSWLRGFVTEVMVAVTVTMGCSYDVGNW